MIYFYIIKSHVNYSRGIFHRYSKINVIKVGVGSTAYTTKVLKNPKRVKLLMYIRVEEKDAREMQFSQPKLFKLLRECSLARWWREINFMQALTTEIA